MTSSPATDRRASRWLIPARHARWLLPAAGAVLIATLAVLAAAATSTLPHRRALLVVLLAAAALAAAALVLAVLAVLPGTLDGHRDRYTTSSAYTLTGSVVLAALAAILAATGTTSPPAGASPGTHPTPGNATPSTTASPAGPAEIADQYLTAVLTDRDVAAADRYLCPSKSQLHEKTRQLVDRILRYTRTGGHITYSWVSHTTTRTAVAATVTSAVKATATTRGGTMLSQPTQTWTLTMNRRGAGWQVCGVHEPPQ